MVSGSKKVAKKRTRLFSFPPTSVFGISFHDLPVNIKPPANDAILLANNSQHCCVDVAFARCLKFDLACVAGAWTQAKFDRFHAQCSTTQQHASRIFLAVNSPC